LEKIPYDISRISALADDLETGWQRMNLMLSAAPARTRNAAIKTVREMIKEMGAGDVMPVFDTPTRQRPPK